MTGRIIREVSTAALRVEGKRAWDEFNKIRKTIPGLDDPNLSKHIRELRGAEEGNSFYAYFPFLFSEAFPNTKWEKKQRLALTGLLTLYQLLINDEMIDEQGAHCAAGIIASNSFQMAALSNLSEFFAPQPLPWKEINKLYGQYSQAILLENGLHNGKVQQYLSRDMIRILSRKSAMAKIIVVSLCLLSGQNELRKPLEDSLDCYYAAEQLFDDFKDWKEDLNAQRYTYLLTQTISTFKLQDKLSSLNPEDRVSMIAKYLYLSGFAEDYLRKLARYCTEAKKKVEGVNCPHWKDLIDSLLMGVHSVRSEVSMNSREALLQSRTHQYILSSLNGNGNGSNGETHCVHPIWKAPRRISDAAADACDFLVKAKGVYEDFMAFGETLPIWVSAYVGAALEEWQRPSSKIKGIKKNRRLPDLLQRMRQWLASEKQQIGWPCLKNVPEDADTTAWVVSFLASTGMLNEKEKQELVTLVLGFQQEDGGFFTIPAQGRSGFQSYGMSHVEVTAVAVDTLLKLGVAPSHEPVTKAIDFIKKGWGKDRIWEAFWWDGQMYATFYSTRALLRTGYALSEADVMNMSESILQKQATDGCWGRDLAGKNLAFETALALRTLMLIGITTPEQKKALARGVVWLLNFQNRNGSFDSRPMLRIPNAGDLNPWENKQWQQGSGTGLGVLVADHNSYFTTATVLGALTDFLLTQSDQKLVALKA
jgi:hypothetical protein